MKLDAETKRENEQAVTTTAQYDLFYALYWHALLQINGVPKV